MAETPTREELLEAHNAYLSVWLEKAQAQRVEMQVLLRGAEDAQALAVEENNALRREVGTLRRTVAQCGCCKEDGGEDGGEGG